MTVDQNTFNQLLAAGFIPAENMEHPNALDILKQMPGATLKFDGANWIAISKSHDMTSSGPDAHEVCAQLYIWANAA